MCIPRRKGKLQDRPIFVQDIYIYIYKYVYIYVYIKLPLLPLFLRQFILARRGTRRCACIRNNRGWPGHRQDNFGSSVAVLLAVSRQHGQRVPITAAQILSRSTPALYLEHIVVVVVHLVRILIGDQRVRGHVVIRYYLIVVPDVIGIDQFHQIFLKRTRR